MVRPAIHDAKPSLSHRSSHQRIVTRSPNHWCAISCAATEKTRLLVRLRRDRRIEQQHVLEGIDRAPVLHRAEELAATGRGDVVELGQRVRHAEVIVVFAQHAPPTTRSANSRLRRQALLRDDADLGATHASRSRDRSRRARRTAGRSTSSATARSARACGRCRGRSRSATGMLLTAICAAGTVAVEVERRLVGGLVPRRDEAARVGILELRVQRALLAGLGVVIDREQAVGLRADLAGVVHRQPVLADGQRLRKDERGRLRFRIDLDLRRRIVGMTGDRRQPYRRECHVQGLQDDACGRLQHVERDRHFAVETQRFRVRHHGHVVMRGAHVARQLRGGPHFRCCRRGLCRGCHGNAGKRQRDSGNQGTTHGILSKSAANGPKTTLHGDALR